MKKGFTLIELLAVITLLGILAVFAYPKVTDAIAASKESAYNETINGIIHAAELYAASNNLGYPTIDTKLDLATLKEAGLLNDKDIINPKNNEIMTGCLVYNWINNNYTFRYSEGNECKDFYTDVSGANQPELYTNMIPVTYNGTDWVYADIYAKWYDYDAKEWANAVVLNSGVTKTVGQTIDVATEVAQMYVWIPRYKYMVFNGNNGSAAVQEINVAFESGTAKTGTVACNDAISSGGSISETCTDTTNGTVTNGTSTYTHPAFILGTTELTGIWVGKFENSAASVESNTIQTVLIKPDEQSWRNAQVAIFYTSISNIASTYGIQYNSTNVDSHMMKNMEWGAVAYLTQSKYGRCTSGTCTEVSRNNSTSFYTGRSDGAPGNSSTITSADGTYTYATTSGMLASTTGNIYGIYDMSGGAWEYVMGNTATSSTKPIVGYNASNTSGFTGIYYDGTSASGTTFPNTKYTNLYSYDSSSNTSHSRGKLGDATKETLAIYGRTYGGWYSDGASFPYGSSPWFIRGGGYSIGFNAGVFNFGNDYGFADSGYSSRSTISRQ